MALGKFGMGPVVSFADSMAFGDYKCLVNLFLLGGNDAFNMIAPSSTAEYNVYARSRQNLAVARDDLLAISPDNPDGASYGLHPSMQRARTLFEAGDLGVVANVGPLVEPVTKSAYLDGSVRLPPQLFSHNDQQDQWQTLKGQSGLSSGWAGRIADILAVEGQGQLLPMNVSASGNVIFQAGNQTVPYTIGLEGANAYGAFAPDVQFGVERRAAFERLLALDPGNMHARALRDVHQRSLGTADLVNNALALAPTLTTTFPDTNLGRQLQIVARLLAVKEAFMASRQIFFVSTGGFDTHDDQNENQPGLLGDVSDSLGAFCDALKELGVFDQAVCFTQSDFGRTLTSNGDGTDHGWGSHQLVCGGPVLGRRIYGQMPVLEIGGEADVTGGRIIPTMSADQYAATFARWFGVPEDQLVEVAPNLGNFQQRDMGFLA